MTVDTLNGTKLIVQVGDGADPEVFAADCIINTERGIVFSTTTNEFTVIDCNNPDDPAWVERIKDSISAAISGSGLLHTSSNKAWFDWLKSSSTKNCRVVVDATAAKGGGYWEGAFHLTNYEVNGNRGEKIQASVALDSDGQIAWVDAV